MIGENQRIPGLPWGRFLKKREPRQEAPKGGLNLVHPARWADGLPVGCPILDATLAPALPASDAPPDLMEQDPGLAPGTGVYGDLPHFLPSTTD